MELNSIKYEKSDGIARIIKDNPPQYGMTLEILLEMKKTLEDAANDEDISVIVISAALLFMIVTMSPVVNTLFGIVTPPPLLAIALPESPATKL